MILTKNSFKMIFLSRIKLYQNFNKIFLSIFLLCFFLQLLFWFKTENIKPNIHIVPPIPSLALIQAFAFGDEEFYFRVLGLRIENAGDSFGRFSALKNYDYSKLYLWFKLLDNLNNKSIYIPTLAATYYSQTQKPQNTKYLVQYLDEFASKDINKNWWWMFQAFNIANYTLKDYPLALKIAYKLSENKNEQAPIWTKEMPAFVHAKMGDDCSAFLFINKLLQDDQNGKKIIKAKEMDFMKHFITQRLDNLRKKNFDPTKC
jgi:hypothetical protein